MKLYRLKDEVKKYITNPDYFTIEEDREHWYNEFGIGLEALEEVEQRVELCRARFSESSKHLDCLTFEDDDCREITEAERLLCEQALNGELFTGRQMKLYGVWKRKNPMGTVEKWLKQSEV